MSQVGRLKVEGETLPVAHCALRVGRCQVGAGGGAPRRGGTVGRTAVLMFDMHQRAQARGDGRGGRRRVQAGGDGRDADVTNAGTDRARPGAGGRSGRAAARPGAGGQSDRNDAVDVWALGAPTRGGTVDIRRYSSRAP